MRADSFAMAAAMPPNRPRVVDAGAAHQADAGAVFVGNEAPAVNLLLVDPAVAVERRANQGWRHRCVLREHELRSATRLG